MKIAMLSTFYPFRGGIAQFNANLLEAFQEAGHDAKAYTFKRQYPDFLFPGKTQYVTPNDNAKPIESIPVLDTANPLMYRHAAKRIGEWQPDLLVMKYWMTYFAPSLGTVAGYLRKRGTKVITVLDNVIPHERRFFDKPLTSWFLRRCDGFVAMSEAVRADLLSLRPDAPSILQPHPLYNHFGQKLEAHEARKALGLDPDKKTILFFGLIRDYKGLDLLIDAVAQLDPSYQLIIAGESYGSFDKYNEQIRRANHPERIHVFNHYIDDKEVPAFFSAADVCALPYRSATQSGITSIAYHFELPLIATDTGGLKESIERPGVGLMIPEITPKAIADTIHRFFEADREQFVSNIQKEKALLSWERFSDGLVSFADRL